MGAIIDSNTMLNVLEQDHVHNHIYNSYFRTIIIRYLAIGKAIESQPNNFPSFPKNSTQHFQAIIWCRDCSIFIMRNKITM